MALDPRWWRLTRMGTGPETVLACLRQCDAAAVIVDADGVPVGGGVLAEGSLVAMVAAFDLHALPDPRSEAIVRGIAPQLLQAAFDGAGLRRLYHSRFDDDPDVLGDLLDLFDPEVRFPEFAKVDGGYRDRVQYCLEAERFRAAAPPGIVVAEDRG